MKSGKGSIKVSLLHHTPLWVAARATRTAWDSHGISDTKDGVIGSVDKELLNRIGNKYKHRSIFAHITIQFICENGAVELEFFKRNSYSFVSGNIVTTNLRVLTDNAFNLRRVLYGLIGTEFGFLLGERKVLVDYPNYRIYSFGVVERFKKDNVHDHGKIPRVIQGFVNKYGYPEYILKDSEGERKHISQHRLLGLNFIENVENKPQINHVDGIKRNNSLSNLEWVTCSENEQHSYHVLGKIPHNKGEKMPSGRDYKGKIRPVLQKDLEGNLIREWFNPTEAANTLNISNKYISAAALGRQHSAGGFLWEYK